MLTGERNLTATLSKVENEIPAKIAPLSGLEVSFMFLFLRLPVGGAPQTRVKGRTLGLACERLRLQFLFYHSGDE